MEQKQAAGVWIVWTFKKKELMVIRSKSVGNLNTENQVKVSYS